MGTTVEKLTARHYKILDLCIQGLDQTKIAEHLGMSRNQVGIIVKSPSFQHQFSIRRANVEEIQDERSVGAIDEVREVLQKSAKLAAERLVDGIGSNNENIAIKSATELLDRSGYPKEQKVSGDKDVGTTIIIEAKQMAVLTESLNLDNIKPVEAAAPTSG